MMGMREHIHRLDLRHGIFRIQELKVPGLGSGVAADIDDGRRRHVKDLTYQAGVHTGPGRIGNDDIRPAMGGEKFVPADIDDVPGKKAGMANAIEDSIFTGILHGGFDDFYSYNPGSLATDEDTDAAGPAVEVVYRLATTKLCVFAGHLIEPFSLAGIGLEERLGPDLEPEVFQLFDYIPLWCRLR